MSNFIIPPLNENPEDDLDYDPIAQAAIARKRKKIADAAAVKAEIDKKAADEEAAKNAAADQRLTDSYTSQLNALAPSEYQMHPQLKEYITNLKEGKAREASQERQQNAMYNAFDTIGKARANEWGMKHVDIGDIGVTAQQANATAEATANTIQAKDLTGHIDMRRQIAESLARKRDSKGSDRRFLKESQFVTQQGKPVLVFNDPNTMESRYFDAFNAPVSESEMLTKTQYTQRNQETITKDAETRKKAATIGTEMVDFSNADKVFEDIDKLLPGQTDKKYSRLEDVKTGESLLGPTVEGADLPGVTVPFVGRYSTSVTDPGGQKNLLDSKIEILTSLWTKIQSGLTVSNTERKAIIKGLEQSATATEGEKIRGLQAFKEMMQKNKQARLRQFGPEAMEKHLEDQAKMSSQQPKQSSGSTGSWGDGQSPQESPQAQPTQQSTLQSDSVTVVAPNGRRKSIPRNQLDAAIKAGGKLAE